MTLNVPCLRRTAISPVVWNVFVTIPLNSTTTGYLQQVLPQIAAAEAICLLTVEPMAGLADVTATAVQQLATIISQYQQVCLSNASAILLLKLYFSRLIVASLDLDRPHMQLFGIATLPA